MQRAPNLGSRPLVRVASSSSPLADVQFYRPGSLLAAAVLGMPVVVALAAAAGALALNRTIPVWLPFLLLLWLPCLPLVWLGMQSVRTTITGVATGRPWRTWDELAWDEIQHVDQRGLLLRIRGRGGVTLSVVPSFLTDGKRFRRHLLLRLPPHALSVRLSQEAEEMVSSGGTYTSAEGDIEGTLIAGVALRYPLSLVLLAVALVAFGVLSVLAIPSPLTAAVCAVAILLGAACVAVAFWLLQRVTVDASGLAIKQPLTRRVQRLRWSEIELVEITKHERLLRFRGLRRLRCVGPGLLPPAQASLFRGFIQTYCKGRNVAVVKRTWI